MRPTWSMTECPGAGVYWRRVAVRQWLASLGYAALSVNYRGSTGFGKAFINACSGTLRGPVVATSLIRYLMQPIGTRGGAHRGRAESPRFEPAEIRACAGESE
ncbi:MAG: hypothetical protein DRI90_00990 [Deltaproteobacteria bacterium]|nr:MAG: hypothetical protein DRI90_00990 [Deltaproteobacteria bacterium]